MDIPPFTHGDANGENKSFFDYNENFADSLRAAIKADHVRTNTPKELILFKAIVIPPAAVNNPVKLIGFPPYHLSPDDWPKHLFGRGFQQMNHQRTRRTPFVIPDLTQTRIPKESPLYEIIRMTAVFPELTSKLECNLALLDPVTNFVARMDTQRPFVALSLALLVSADFLLKVKGDETDPPEGGDEDETATGAGNEDYLDASHWPSWFFSTIAQTFVLRVSEHAKQFNKKLDCFNSDFFETPENYEQLAKHFNEAQTNFTDVHVANCSKVWAYLQEQGKLTLF